MASSDSTRRSAFAAAAVSLARVDFREIAGDVADGWIQLRKCNRE